MASICIAMIANWTTRRLRRMPNIWATCIKCSIAVQSSQSNAAGAENDIVTFKGCIRTSDHRIDVSMVLSEHRPWSNEMVMLYSLPNRVCARIVVAWWAAQWHWWLIWRRIETNDPTNATYAMRPSSKWYTFLIIETAFVLVISRDAPPSCSPNSYMISVYLYRQLSGLKQHLTTHTNERKYICEVCNNAYKHVGHLTTHMMTHGIGIKKWYECKLCQKYFYNKGNYKVGCTM